MPRGRGPETSSSSDERGRTFGTLGEDFARCQRRSGTRRWAGRCAPEFFLPRRLDSTISTCVRTQPTKTGFRKSSVITSPCPPLRRDNHSHSNRDTNTQRAASIVPWQSCLRTGNRRCWSRPPSPAAADAASPERTVSSTCR